MEKISSRKNEYIKHLRKLAADSVYRSSCGGAVRGAMPLRIVEAVLKATSRLNCCSSRYRGSYPKEPAGDIRNAIILESVQDPGNLGTVIRTAAAFGIGAVILTGACADLYNPKTVKATMGAIFRQRVLKLDLGETAAFAEANSLTLCAAILSDEAEILGDTELGRAAVCIGNEGSGLSRELSDLCRRKIIIPMQPGNESLNASVAASVFMWEMRKNG